MKWSAVCMLLAAGMLLTAAENLIENADFNDGFKSYSRNDKEKIFSAGSGTLQIKGAAGVDHARLNQTLSLKPEALQGRKFILSFDARSEALSGNLMVAVREWGKDGKTITYHAVKFNKWSKHDWKAFRKEFTISGNAAFAGLYITADYLKPEDSFQLKNLSLTVE